MKGYEVCEHRVWEAVDKVMKDEIEKAKYKPIKDEFNRLMEEKEVSFNKDPKNYEKNIKFDEEEREITEIEILHDIGQDKKFQAQVLKDVHA